MRIFYCSMDVFICHIVPFGYCEGRSNLSYLHSSSVRGSNHFVNFDSDPVSSSVLLCQEFRLLHKRGSQRQTKECSNISLGFEIGSQKLYHSKTNLLQILKHRVVILGFTSGVIRVAVWYNDHHALASTSQ